MRADCLPHANVTVRVAGEALTEHHTENFSADDAMTATSFVEAVPGARFTVDLNLEPGFAYRNHKDRISFLVYVDGQWVKDSIITSHVLPHSVAINGLLETLSGVSTLKRLSFAEHTSTDGRAESSLIKKLEKVGEIKVELRRCRVVGREEYVGRASVSKGISEDAIPEKALKGRSISSHTSLGPAEVTTPISWLKCTYPYGNNPIATYIFQYRTRRDLEIEGILEREASPVPLEDRDPDELSPAELREQVRLLRARQAAVEIKQENKPQKRARARSVTLGHDDEDDDDDGDVTITSITDRRKRARASMEGAETIDLTED